MHFWCIVGLLIFSLVLLIVAQDHRIKEGYGVVLGSIAPFRTSYYECLSECEREDPSRYLGKTRGSLFCQKFCDDGLTELSKNSPPPNSSDNSLLESDISRGMEGCQRQVSEKCAQDCRYSNRKDCQEVCRKINAVNCSTVSWIWK